MQTMLLKLQASLNRLLIFRRKIINAFAFRTFELDECFLRHNFYLILIVLLISRYETKLTVARTV